MLSEYITSLADVSFHIVAYLYSRFRYSGKNPMRFAVFWRISVRFCCFQTPLTPPSLKEHLDYEIKHLYRYNWDSTVYLLFGLIRLQEEN